MNRREFVKRAFAVAGTTVLPRFAFANEGEKKMTIEEAVKIIKRNCISYGAWDDEIEKAFNVLEQHINSESCQQCRLQGALYEEAFGRN